MKYSFNFGVVSRTGGTRPGAASAGGGGGGAFRIALLGDFSGRANRGELETGDALAKRKPIRVDVDNIDAVIQRMKITLSLPLGQDAAISVPIGGMDDFHPDQLFEKVDVFTELGALRRRLQSSATADKAIKEVQSWAGKGKKVRTPRNASARGAELPAGATLDDFANLLGRPTSAAGGGGKAAQQAADLVKKIVGPYIVPAKDPRRDAMLAAVDTALSDAMRALLHHPDFQVMESIWRGVDFLTRRLETDSSLQIILYDLTAQELAADLAAADDLAETGLYRLLVEQPALDAQQGPLSLLIGLYTFEMTPPHAELLGRVAKLAASAGAGGAPFIAAIGADVLTMLKDEDVHPMILDAWKQLGLLPESNYLGLTVPRFLLRHPYGERTDPIDSFDFEEFTPAAGLSAMLWGHGGFLAALLLGETFRKQGKKMKPGSILSVGDMPYHFFTDADGDQVALPCTERLINLRTAEQLTRRRFMPLLSMQGKPEVRLGSLYSLAGPTLAGPWAPVTIKPDATAAAPQPAAAEDASGGDSPAQESAQDAELAALLAEIGGDSGGEQGVSQEPPAASEEAADAGGDAPAEEEPMDPELAALLAEL